MNANGTGVLFVTAESNMPNLLNMSHTYYDIKQAIEGGALPVLVVGQSYHYLTEVNSFGYLVFDGFGTKFKITPDGGTVM